MRPKTVAGLGRKHDLTVTMYYPKKVLISNIYIRIQRHNAGEWEKVIKNDTNRNQQRGLIGMRRKSRLEDFNVWKYYQQVLAFGKSVWK